MKWGGKDGRIRRRMTREQDDGRGRRANKWRGRGWATSAATSIDKSEEE
jgi:hypothetical protein